MKDEDLKKVLEIQEKIIKSNKIQSADVNELIETQKRTLKLIEKTQESLIRSIDKQSNETDSLKDMMNFQIDSLKDMMNFYFKMLVIYILILHIMSYMI